MKTMRKAMKVSLLVVFCCLALDAAEYLLRIKSGVFVLINIIVYKVVRVENGMTRKQIEITVL
jgi:hypothetical protein